MQIRPRWVMSSFVLIGALGCDEDGGPDGVGGVSGDQRVIDLSEEEARDVCHAVQGKFDRVGRASQKITCIGNKFVAGHDEAVCEANLDECTSGPLDRAFTLDCDAPGGGQGKLEGCDITVGELNACVDELLRAAEAGAAKVDCSSTREDLQSAFAAEEPPESCSNVAKRCDALAGLEQ